MTVGIGGPYPPTSHPPSLLVKTENQGRPDRQLSRPPRKRSQLPYQGDGRGLRETMVPGFSHPGIPSVQKDLEMLVQNVSIVDTLSPKRSTI